MMSRPKVAKALGLSRTTVEVIERRAIAKLAVALGQPPPPIPPWMERQWEQHETQNECSNCGEPGHNARGCLAPKREAEPPTLRLVEPSRSYKVICVSIYLDDLARLDAMVARLKSARVRNATRSAVIRAGIDALEREAAGR